MNVESQDLRAAVERHNREITELRAELHALKDGQAKKALEAEIQRRISDLEADIGFQELQEQMAKEDTEKHKKRGWFYLR